jgi:hypothetical protein
MGPHPRITKEKYNMEALLTEANKKLIASYVRSFVSAAIAVYLSGNEDPKALWAAGVAAVVPSAARYLNPKDKSFGRGSK